MIKGILLFVVILSIFGALWVFKQKIDAGNEFAQQAEQAVQRAKNAAKDTQEQIKELDKETIEPLVMEIHGDKNCKNKNESQSGVTLTPNLLENSLDGVIVTSIAKGSVWDRMGLKDKDNIMDIEVKVNQKGKATRKYYQINRTNPNWESILRGNVCNKSTIFTVQRSIQ